MRPEIVHDDNLFLLQGRKKGVLDKAFKYFFVYCALKYYSLILPVAAD